MEALQKIGLWINDLNFIEELDYSREADRFFRFGGQRGLFFSQSYETAMEMAEARVNFMRLLGWKVE
jgi:hypothetical protein